MRRPSTAPRAFPTAAAVLLPLGLLVGLRAPTVHLELKSSRPAAGDTLHQSPDRLRLEFTQSVDPNTSRITLVVSDGTSIPLTPEGDPTDDRVLVARVDDAPAGWYRVDWQVLSGDGHPVRGSFSFYVTGPAGAGTSMAPGESPPIERPAAARFPAVTALLRGVAAALQLALAGVLFFSIRLGPQARLARLARLIAVLALFVTAAHLVGWLSYASFGGRPGAWVGVLASAGRLEVARLAMVGLAVATLFAGGPPLAALGAAAVAVLCGAGIGHAASFTPLLSIPAKALHLGSAALWFGGLLTLVFGERDAASVARNAAYVSQAALWAVVAVAASGVAQALLIARPGALIGSSYGLMIAAKTLGLGVLVGFGAYHRMRLLPRLAATPDGARLRGSVAREVVVFLVMMLLAGALGYMTPPEATATTVSALR